ncbi:hypothetical protein EPHNCH_0599 [Anaplasma phagocytophilum str. NCH-1]|nr:hypothetical protein EPHNCH_0599 [Anaplasma phagocytophilum str. NCH-1]
MPDALLFLKTKNYVISFIVQIATRITKTFLLLLPLISCDMHHTEPGIFL